MASDKHDIRETMMSERKDAREKKRMSEGDNDDREKKRMSRQRK
jgi:hypothetical protein